MGEAVTIGIRRGAAVEGHARCERHRSIRAGVGDGGLVDIRDPAEEVPVLRDEGIGPRSGAAGATVMALSAFDDKANEPGQRDLEKTLGRSAAHWVALVAHIAAEFAPLDESWNFAGAKWGWSLRLKQKKRTVLYMTPCRKHFLVGFALGERAVQAAREGGLPGPVLEQIEQAPKYAEGRGVRLEVRTKKDLEAVKRIAAIKMAN